MITNLKNIIIILAIILIVNSCKSYDYLIYPYKSDKSIVSIHSLYSGYGKIFNDIFTDVKYYGPPPKDFSKNIELNQNMILESEKILFKDINNFYTKIPGEKIYFENPKKYYKYYYRQYTGYLNIEGDTIIYINLLNFRNKIKAKKYFYDWKSYFNNGMGYFYEDNRITYTINLNNQIIRK